MRGKCQVFSRGRFGAVKIMQLFKCQDQQNCSFFSQQPVVTSVQNYRSFLGSSDFSLRK